MSKTNLRKPEVNIKPKFVANPGKKLPIKIGATTYLRLPVKSNIIEPGEDLLKTLDKLIGSEIKPSDWLFISEKVLCVSQKRIINMNDIKVTSFARFLARRIKNNYRTDKFKGF